ncbi:MAG TPA: hypothetical protein VK110_11540 [Salinisphaeraceae bacterium]|nr:hypothetical protein [Salinisphaeraceae bacterium]
MQWVTDLSAAILASVASFLLSWPFWRDFEYWAESHVAWWVYFIGGFVLAVYVFYVFIGSLRMLFLHAADEIAESAALVEDEQSDEGRLS